MEMLGRHDAKVGYLDPHVAEIPRTHEQPVFAGWRSGPKDAGRLCKSDAVLISIDRDVVDCALVAKHAGLIVDTRTTVARKRSTSGHPVKARPSPAAGRQPFASRQCFIQYLGEATLSATISERLR